MRTLALALLAATALTGPARAQANPNLPMARPEDPNMRVQNYSPFVRTRIVGTIGRPVVVTVAPGEEPKRFIFGDNGGTWEGPDPAEVKETPLGNNFPLYPVKPGYATIQVITQRPGQPDRAYQFAVEARALPAVCQEQPAGCDDPGATYGLSFRYPEDEAAAKAAAREAEQRAARDRWQATAPARQAARQQAQQVVMRDRLVVDFFNGGGYRNWRYEAQGNAAGRAGLLPDAVTDNGQETAFRYSGNRPIPSFYVIAADGSEQTVNPVVRDDVVVLPQVALEWRVRLGDAVLYVHNRAFNPTGYAPGTGTTSPDVVRVVRQAAAR